MSGLSVRIGRRPDYRGGYEPDKQPPLLLSRCDQLPHIAANLFRQSGPTSTIDCRGDAISRPEQGNRWTCRRVGQIGPSPMLIESDDAWCETTWRLVGPLRFRTSRRSPRLCCPPDCARKWPGLRRTATACATSSPKREPGSPHWNGWPTKI